MTGRVGISRRAGEWVDIGPVRVYVSSVRGGQVRLSIEAPRHLDIHRGPRGIDPNPPSGLGFAGDNPSFDGDDTRPTA